MRWAAHRAWCRRNAELLLLFFFSSSDEWFGPATGGLQVACRLQLQRLRATANKSPESKSPA
uniref:Secreted protein n=1 Tax=Setaria viridis TaxID=4556 RepID=A0A4U6T246_SETVI|nr:hypothetical protein SEVIR_9G316450v2 [Setaria viridis]